MDEGLVYIIRALCASLLIVYDVIDDEKCILRIKIHPFLGPAYSPTLSSTRRHIQAHEFGDLPASGSPLFLMDEPC